MKRTSINILCILILVALSGSVLLPVFYMGYSFGMGFARGWQDTPDVSQSVAQPRDNFDLAFNPDIELVLAPKDSVRMADGNVYPAIIERASVLIPADPATGVSSWVSATLSILTIVIGIAVLYTFIRFVVNINKGHVFEDSNVRLLRWVGSLLLVCGGTQIAEGIVNDYRLSQTGIALDGYSISTYWAIPWGTIIFGLLSLLMAQVWARGIAMKREQELTI